MFSMRLESRERQQTVEYERRARDISDQLLGAVASDETLLKDPDWLGDILTRAIPADGVGVWLGGAHAFSGSCPPVGGLPSDRSRALNGTAAGKVFATDNISSLVPGSNPRLRRLGPSGHPDLRAARAITSSCSASWSVPFRWAGDPHKPVKYGPNGPRLTPRESFAEWKELVHARSAPFTASEIRVAETLAPP